jgi:hypothetical protein
MQLYGSVRVISFKSIYIYRWVTGGHPVAYPMDSGASVPGLKLSEREANYSPPSNVEVKNGGDIPPLPYTPP